MYIYMCVALSKVRYIINLIVPRSILITSFSYSFKRSLSIFVGSYILSFSKILSPFRRHFVNTIVLVVFNTSDKRLLFVVDYYSSNNRVAFSHEAISVYNIKSFVT